MLEGVGALFDKLYGFFCSKLGACPLASLPSLADSSPARPSETYQVRHRISFHNKANQASKASKQSTAKHTKAKQATKPRKPNKSETSKQTKENHKPSQLKPNQGK